MDTTIVRHGGCQCGGIRYELSCEPHTFYVCHCLECRRQSASAFGISVIVPAAALRLAKGEPKLWSRATASGGILHCTFCPDCGSRLWHRSPGDDVLSIKGGSLDEPVDLTRAMHIWTSRKMPGIRIPEGVRCYEEEPPGMAPSPTTDRQTV